VLTKKTYAKLSSLLGFEHLIAPCLIKLIYRLGLLVIAIAGVLSVVDSGGASGGVGRVLLAIGGTLLALLLWRLMSELWILAFNIFQRLGEIRDLLAGRNAAPDKE
jgi:hypothetical protein